MHSTTPRHTHPPVGLSRLEYFGLRNGYGWCAVPVSVDLVAGLAAGWAQLACLQLQLAAGDLREGGAAGLAQLARFKRLRELSLGVGVEGAAPPGVALQVGFCCGYCCLGGCRGWRWCCVWC